jgi:Mn2+/Fe2+ NRAMP family transporter
MYVALVFQVAGMVGGIARIFALAGSTWREELWAVLVVSSCAILLVAGRYKLVERFSTILVALFTVCTVVAVGSLQWTDYAITSEQLLSGLTFQLPDNFMVAFSAFGIIGVGASELIYYPYWCLEKGYGRHAGPNDGSAAWYERSRGWIRVMRVDAWVSLVIYTGATIAFYLLGAAVLHGKGLRVEDIGVIETLSYMYREAFGAWGLTIFLAGGFCVLYSTVFVATASNARLFADALPLFRVLRYERPEHRLRMIKTGCVLLPLASLTVFLIWGAPVTLVIVGAVAQGLMLPFLGIAAVYFRFRHTDRPLRPGMIWTVFLVLAALAMVVVGVYQVQSEVRKRLRPAAPAAMQLFNGENLDGFRTWLVDAGRDDPRGVFTVANGVIWISGDGPGYLATDREFENYRLVTLS